MERLAQAVSALPRSEEVLPRPAVMSAEDEKLAARIERAVRRGTSDKVRDLRVEIRWDGVHLMGRCGSFYCKQLAQTAALSLIGKSQLHNQIEVW
jgi:hypothetical protein